MKLAVSNIGWTKDEEPQVAELLQSLGVKYVEIAPTKTWTEPIEINPDQARQYVEWWASYEIEIVAFQSMLFSHPDYKLFNTAEERRVTKDYLKSFTELAGVMGAKRMVFGSPKNRQKGALSYQDALTIATDFFGDIAKTALQNDVVFCIEPNAPQYNCDFVSTAKEGIGIVERVNSNGFGLHLDIACMTLAGDDVRESILQAKQYLQHFHISSPMLDLVEDRPDIKHRDAAQALQDIDYKGFVSIEMRPGNEGTNTERVRQAVLFAQSVYR